MPKGEGRKVSSLVNTVLYGTNRGSNNVFKDNSFNGTADKLVKETKINANKRNFWLNTGLSMSTGLRGTLWAMGTTVATSVALSTLETMGVNMVRNYLAGKGLGFISSAANVIASNTKSLTVATGNVAVWAGRNGLMMGWNASSIIRNIAFSSAISVGLMATEFVLVRYLPAFIARFGMPTWMATTLNNIGIDPLYVQLAMELANGNKINKDVSLLSYLSNSTVPTEKMIMHTTGGAITESQAVAIKAIEEAAAKHNSAPVEAIVTEAVNNTANSGSWTIALIGGVILFVVTIGTIAGIDYALTGGKNTEKVIETLSDPVGNTRSIFNIASTTISCWWSGDWEAYDKLFEQEVDIERDLIDFNSKVEIGPTSNEILKDIEDISVESADGSDLPDDMKVIKLNVENAAIEDGYDTDSSSSSVDTKDLDPNVEIPIISKK